MARLTAEQERQAHALLNRLIDCDAAERDRVLRDPQLDAAVRDEVRAMLTEDEEGGSEAGFDLRTILQAPAIEAAPLPETIGGYRIHERLGEGGMGVVYLAEQLQPVRRRVALKLIKLGIHSDAARARFQLEGSALARMNHDAIAKVYEFGTTDDGHPFFAMELVEGMPLNKWCDHHQLTVRERIELVQQVCHGVEHAHRKGVLHRDLKPGNILVSTSGARPVAKIIDFGVARAIDDGEDLQAGLVTRPGALVGTPAYMSPEQAEGRTAELDTRSDVYALGVVLYEQLTGRLPFPGESRSTDAATEPPRPSTSVGTADPDTESFAERRGVTAERLGRELRGDLDWIVVRALEVDPERRYSSAQNLAADLQRHLDGQPVLAGPPSAGYRARKFLRRHRATIAAALLVFFTAIIGAVVAIDRALVASRNEQLANQRERDAKEEARRNQVLAGKLASKVDEFNHVAGAIRARRLARRTTTLGPGWPEHLDAIRSWLDDLDDLKTLRPPIESALRRLRSLAQEVGVEQRTARMRQHPMYDTWQTMRRRARSWSYLIDIHEGRRQLQRVTLDEEHRSKSATELGQLALVRTLFGGRELILGEEPLALALATECVRRSPGKPYEPFCWRALAYAQLANGQLDDARESARRAVECAQGDVLDRVTAGLKDLHDVVSDPTTFWRNTCANERHLRKVVAPPRTWRFPVGHEAEEFLHDALTAFLDDLERLELVEEGQVRKKLAWARAVRQLTFDNAAAALTWNEVRQQVRSDPRFAGAVPELADDDVLGLVPLGPDPRSGLQEFLHVRSAWDGYADPGLLLVQGRRPDGTLPESIHGMVFVLLPGGTATLGVQGKDPEAPRFVTGNPDVDTIRQVRLDPYFLAKFEMTQKVWRALWVSDPATHEPSSYEAGGNVTGQRITDRNPVETVTWQQCQDLVSEHGLRLPTSAQWEYARDCGGALTWPIATTELPRIANLRDQSMRAYSTRVEVEPWSDGFIYHAPVGSFAPNAFGLHDLLGNVGEWMRDVQGGHPRERPGDGFSAPNLTSQHRLVAGGAFDDLAWRVLGRPLVRRSMSDRVSQVGLRPVRSVRAQR